VIPVDLQLSRNVLDFHFSSDSTTPLIQEFASISNKSNTTAEFNSSNFLIPFNVQPVKEIIEPIKSLNMEFTYTPSSTPKEEITLIKAERRK
jgi:hypothetical protein